MTYIVEYSAYSCSAPWVVLARDFFNGRETFIGTFHSRKTAEDECDELQDRYNHGENCFIHGDE